MGMIPSVLAAVPSAWVSARIIFALVTALIASSAMFWALVRRWTSQREWVAIAEWGRETGFRFRRDRATPPDPLGALKDRNPVVRICLSNGRITIVQFEADPPANPAPPIVPGSSAPLPSIAPVSLPRRPIWNLMMRRIESSWSPTGLRPAAAQSSLLDLYSLSSFPLMGAQERFVLFSADSAAARALSASPARALLPPDIGLLLTENFLILDFSSRPFDTIEFSRMLAVIEQVSARLPVMLESAQRAANG